MKTIYDYLYAYCDFTSKNTIESSNFDGDIYQYIYNIEFKNSTSPSQHSAVNPFFSDTSAFPSCIDSDTRKSIMYDILNRYTRKALNPYVLNKSGEIDDIFYLPTAASATSNSWWKVCNMIGKTIIRNSYTIEHLYNLTQIDYEPLNNYDKTSTITTTKTGTETDTYTPTGTETTATTPTGTETTATTPTGSETQTITPTGTEVTNTIRNGEVITETTPTGTETDTTGVWGYNESDAANNLDKKVKSFDGRKDTNTQTFDNVTDNTSLTFTNRSTTNTTSFNDRETTTTTSFADRTDTTTKSFDDRTDTTTKSFDDRTDTINERTFGNIGVTTSQQMAESEISYANKMRFVEMVTDIIIDSFTVGVWDEGGVEDWLLS